jgi:hypothetical protein
MKSVPVHTIQEPEMMVSLVSNPLGFCGVKSLPNGRAFHAEDSRDRILAGLIPIHPEPGARKLGVCAENARPTGLKTVGRFAANTARGSPRNPRTYLIEPRLTSFSSGM